MLNPNLFKATEHADRNALAVTTPTSSKQGHWWHDRGLRTLNCLLFIPIMSEYVQGYDASLINNVQLLKTWQDAFNHPAGSLLGIMSASYWIGNILGVSLITTVSDRWGRRMAMFVGSIICIVGTALVAGAVAPAMFIVGRLLLGMGGVLVGAIGPILTTELAYPSHRATATALSNTQYSTGAIVAAWVTFGTFRLANSWAWRIPSLFQALPSVLQAVGIFFLPESPRYLVSVGKEEKALEVLAHYYANGDREDEVVQYAYKEITETIELEIASHKTKWSELWSTPGNRWRSFIMIWCGICKQCSGNSLVSYYLGAMLKNAGITEQIKTTLINATSQMFSLACSVGFAFLPAIYGRRPLMLLSMALMFLVFLLITITTGVFINTKNNSASYASVAFIYLYSGVHNLGWTGAVMLYVVEILPYTLRAKGIALFWLMTGAAGAFSTYVNPLGIERFGWKFYFFYVAWIAVEFVVVYFVFVETKGPSLEGIAMIFDGKKAVIATVNPVAEAIKEGKLAEKDGHIVEHVEQVDKQDASGRRKQV